MPRARTVHQGEVDEAHTPNRRGDRSGLAADPAHRRRRERPARPNQSQHREHARRDRSQALRQLHRAPRPLHRRRRVPGALAALERGGLPPRRARGRAGARREPAALARRQLLLELPLDGRHRPARRAAAASRDGVGHGREQSLRHARVPRLRRAAEDRALHLRESRHRHVDGSAAVGRVLQLRARTRPSRACAARTAARIRGR